MFCPRRGALVARRAQKRLDQDPFLLTPILENLKEKLTLLGMTEPQDRPIHWTGIMPGNSAHSPQDLAFGDVALASQEALVLVNTLHNIDDVCATLGAAAARLKPGGVLLGAVFGEETLVELEPVFMRVEQELTQGVSPRCMPKLDIKTMAQLLRRVGFQQAITDKETFKVIYGGVQELAQDLRTLGLTNTLDLPYRPPLHRRFWQQAETALCATTPGPEPRTFMITYEVIYFTGF